ncbi:MAG: DUF5320 domain-containing protein [Candidatus Izemoplasmatales bacterium]|nr:DUF5320 domain-containing protein [Candidatus Izemoplasmatales bacterium]MDY0138984.1 DUF5320 domain-containing protein [Candidatus Izemoplasmatales bacterium]
MPRRDGTGPNGYGPLTGRKMGNCGNGRGLGYGLGYGRNAQPYSDTKTDLAREKELLEQRIKDIEKKLEDK